MLRRAFVSRYWDRDPVLLVAQENYKCSSIINTSTPFRVSLPLHFLEIRVWKLVGDYPIHSYPTFKKRELYYITNEYDLQILC
jgi:hypothetical protein